MPFFFLGILTPHYETSIGTTFRIKRFCLNFDNISKWRWVILPSCHLAPSGSKLRFSMNSSLDGPQNSVEAVEEIRLRRPVVVEPWSTNLMFMGPCIVNQCE